MKKLTKEEKAKKSMLNSVYVHNRHGNISFLKKVIKAMDKVDRKYFVRNEDISRAYIDFPLPIGYDQTISQPSTVARMLVLSKLKKGMKVAEVGSGSGWNACLIAYLVYPGKVISVERIPELHEFAKNNMNKLKIRGWIKNINVDFKKGSVFSLKEIKKEKFDGIIVTASASEELAEKLKKFNFKKLVFPSSSGYLEVWRKKRNKIELEHREERFVFVPLIEK